MPAARRPVQGGGALVLATAAHLHLQIGRAEGIRPGHEMAAGVDLAGGGAVVHLLVHRTLQDGAHRSHQAQLGGQFGLGLGLGARPAGAALALAHESADHAVNAAGAGALVHTGPSFNRRKTMRLLSAQMPSRARW